ncbi:MAG: hypothetical protein ACI4TK_03775, partial [Agathobacter sp.]
ASGRAPQNINGIKEYDTPYGKEYTIEINTLEELLKLCEQVDESIIIRVYKYKFTDHKDYSMTIYDDYIE